MIFESTEKVNNKNLSSLVEVNFLPFVYSFIPKTTHFLYNQVNKFRHIKLNHFNYSFKSPLKITLDNMSHFSQKPCSFFTKREILQAFKNLFPQLFLLYFPQPPRSEKSRIISQNISQSFRHIFILNLVFLFFRPEAKVESVDNENVGYYLFEREIGRIKVISWPFFFKETSFLNCFTSILDVFLDFGEVNSYLLGLSKDLLGWESYSVARAVRVWLVH